MVASVPHASASIHPERNEQPLGLGSFRLRKHPFVYVPLWVFAAGVTAGIDGALRLAAELRGEDVAKAIQLYMAYAPEPPFDSGTPERAPPAILEQARAAVAAITERRADTARRVAARLGIAP